MRNIVFPQKMRPPTIWIRAAKLEEAHGNGAAVVERIIEKAVASLSQYEVGGAEEAEAEAEAEVEAERRCS